jgi:hypothetical protein
VGAPDALSATAGEKAAVEAWKLDRGGRGTAMSGLCGALKVVSREDRGSVGAVTFKRGINSGFAKRASAPASGRVMGGGGGGSGVTLSPKVFEKSPVVDSDGRSAAKRS